MLLRTDNDNHTNQPECLTIAVWFSYYLLCPYFSKRTQLFKH